MTFFCKKVLTAILPALAGDLQAFVYLALQQLFGGQLCHVLRHLEGYISFPFSCSFLYSSQSSAVALSIRYCRISSSEGSCSWYLLTKRF